MILYNCFWFRSACDSNEQHDAEVDSARTAAEKDVTKNSDDIIQQIDRKKLLSFSHMTVSFVHLNKSMYPCNLSGMITILPIID